MARVQILVSGPRHIRKRGTTTVHQSSVARACTAATGARRLTRRGRALALVHLAVFVGSASGRPHRARALELHQDRLLVAAPARLRQRGAWIQQIGRQSQVVVLLCGSRARAAASPAAPLRATCPPLRPSCSSCALTDRPVPPPSASPSASQSSPSSATGTWCVSCAS